MIVNCPFCRTAHSKSSAELVGGAQIACRNCGESFRPGGAGEATTLDVAPPADPTLPAASLPQPPRPPAAEASPMAGIVPAPVTMPEVGEETELRARSVGRDSPRAPSPVPAPPAGRSDLHATTQVGAPLHRRARFPKEELLRWVETQWRDLRNRSWQFRATLGAIAASPLILVGVTTTVVMLDDPTRWSTEPQVLMSLPASVDGAVEVGPVGRGAELYAYEEVGAWALVRDMRGRAGYVQTRHIDSDSPDSIPEYAFADCQPAITEETNDACLARAQARFDSCRGVCADRDRDEEQSCLERCQSRLDDCSRACEGREEEPAPAPTLQEPERRSAASVPAERPKPVPAVKKPAPKKKKKKR